MGVETRTLRMGDLGQASPLTSVAGDMSQLEGCGGSLHQFEMKATRLAALFRPDMDIAKVVSNIVTSQDFTASDGRVEAEMVRNSEVLERARRDGGYGHHGHCSQPFVI